MTETPSPCSHFFCHPGVATLACFRLPVKSLAAPAVGSSTCHGLRATSRAVRRLSLGLARLDSS